MSTNATTPSGPVVGTARSWHHALQRLSSAAAIVCLVVLGAAVAGMSLAAVAGWRLHVVTTESMAPAVPRGSLAVVSPAVPEDLTIGRAVVFAPPGHPDARVLHRIVGMGALDGERAFRTKGDANATPDPRLVGEDAITGRLRWSLPLLGRAAETLRPPVSHIVLIGIPLLLVIAGFLSPPRDTSSTVSGRRQS